MCWTWMGWCQDSQSQPCSTSPLARVSPAAQWSGMVPPVAGHSTEASLEEEYMEAQD